MTRRRSRRPRSSTTSASSRFPSTSSRSQDRSARTSARRCRFTRRWAPRSSTRSRSPAPSRRSFRSHHERWDGTGYPDGLRGERHPDWRAHPRRRGHVRCGHVGPAVSAIGVAGSRARDPRARGRPRARPHARQTFRGDPPALEPDRPRTTQRARPDGPMRPPRNGTRIAAAGDGATPSRRSRKRTARATRSTRSRKRWAAASA